MTTLAKTLSSAHLCVDTRGDITPRSYELAIALVELNRLAMKYLQGTGRALYCAERDGTLDPAHVHIGDE